MKNFRNMTIEEVENTMQQNISVNDSLPAVLMSKSMAFLGGEIATLKKSIHEDVEKVLASNKRLTIASWVYSMAMLLLTTAIAFSALVQSKVINIVN